MKNCFKYIAFFACAAAMATTTGCADTDGDGEGEFEWTGSENPPGVGAVVGRGHCVQSRIELCGHLF